MTVDIPVAPASGPGASGLRWKLNRLRTMGWAEIASRVHHAVQARLEARGIGLVRDVPTPSDREGTRWIAFAPLAPEDATACLAAAEEILAGRFNVFALRGVALGFPPQWLRDPRTGTLSPLTFGKSLNYRDERIVGDIKYLWEPSRHLELVTLAQAWHLTGEAAYAQAARTLVESWLDDSPYPLGPHWTSSLEHAVRLVNWSVAWQILQAAPQGGADAAGSVFAGDSGQTFRRRWLEAVYRHCHFIAGHFSRHSSANNHLLGEYMGLHVASLTWPCWPESARWQAVARSGFEREALLQNAADGVNREQGIWYHHEVADMMLLCGLAARAAGGDFGVPYWQRLEKMLGFVHAMMSAGGQVPMIGDSDDAVMVRFTTAADFDPYRSLLATGAVLFGRADFAAKARCFDGKSRWLLGAEGERSFDRLRAEAPAWRDGGATTGRAFEEGGYWILGDALDGPREVRLVADAGPLGYLSIAAHGHADALAFTLGMAGRELLIDPGTYAYHTQQRWRDYFKGTSAHNTLRVDGVDQSVSGGNFMWLHHARARCHRAVFGLLRDEWSGSHDGYRRLADPVTHTRDIVLDKVAGEIRVVDEVACAGAHEVELFWHFAEGCEVALVGDAVVGTHDGVSVAIRMPDDAWQPDLVWGREDPPLGWISRRFDEKVPTFTAVWRGRVAGTTKLVTLLTLAGRPAPKDQGAVASLAMDGAPVARATASHVAAGH